MTETTESGSAPTPTTAPAYEADRLYLVELNCPVECPKGSGKMLYPGKNRRNMVKGSLIEGFGQAVNRAVAL